MNQILNFNDYRNNNSNYYNNKNKKAKKSVFFKVIFIES